MDTRDHKQLIMCHVQNIRAAIMSIGKATMLNEFNKAGACVGTIILNAECIETLAAELFGEQSKRKDQYQCSPQQAKSASP